MTDVEKSNKGKKPGLIRRGVRAVFQLGVTAGVVSIAVFALVMGNQELTRRAEAVPAPEPAAVMPVETRAIAFKQSYDITRTFVGQIEAQRTAVVSFELSGRLASIAVDEGQRVAAGQPIAALETRLLTADRQRLEASKAALAAQLKFAQQTVERRSKLGDQGFSSQATLDEARARADELAARIAELEAALISNDIQLEKSQASAPFAGRVTERRVDGGESVAPGQPLVEIVEDGPVHLRVGVPLDLAEDELASAKVVAGGETLEARLVTLRPDVDPVTRTRTALFEITGATALTFGQTAQLRVTGTVATPGLWVPVTTLKEGVRGQWTLLAVDAQDVVRSLSVQVVHSRGDEVFVRGAFPDGMRLIASGPQRVSVGQRVDPQPAT